MLAVAAGLLRGARGGACLRPSLHLTRSLSQTSRALYASSTASLSQIRNIGIIAHIDAGKTTTTERMLHYAGLTRSIGDVDEGDTVMDFLKQEQERGITIQSAAITFGWRDHQVNLIDTPGHVDFTIEVERSLRVLDGAVALLDGVSGVEAQTEVVWRQAAKNGVPRLVFVNKLDREGASVGLCVRSLRDRLGARPLLLQQAVEADDGAGYTGALVDLVANRVVDWDDEAGKTMREVGIDEHPGGEAAAQKAREMRAELVDAVAEHDDTLMERLMECDSAALIGADELRAAIRRVTLRNECVPVLCGMSFKNRGVQPLMDAIIDYLPSPLERGGITALVEGGDAADAARSGGRPARGHKAAAGQSASSSREAKFAADPNGDLLAYAFKVTVDKQRGPLVFLRVYSGTLEARAQLTNATRGGKERITRLHQVYAKRVEDMDAAPAGSIVMAVGLKATATGDAIVAHSDKRRLSLPGLDIPPAVFFRSIDAASTADEAALQDALRAMLLEDPSLVLRVDGDTGQRQIGGQGELHLEIVEDRLRTDHGVSARLGPILIALREVIDGASVGRVAASVDREIGGKRHAATVSVSISDFASATGPSSAALPMDATVSVEAEELTEELAERCGLSDDEVAAAAENGARAALGRGPLLGYPVVRAHVSVRVEELSDGASPLAVTLATAEAVQRLLQRPAAVGGARLLEPVMAVAVTAPDTLIGTVMSDLTGRRRGNIAAIESVREGKSRVTATAPLRALVGYASALRSVTSGAAAFNMAFDSYERMSADAQTTVMTEHGRPPVNFNTESD